MEDTSTSTENGSSSALDVSSSNVTRARGSNSFSPTELGSTLAADGSPPQQQSGGVVDALLQYMPVALGERTSGGARAEAKDGNAIPDAASNIDTPPPGNPRAVERAVAEDKPLARSNNLVSPQQQPAEKGPHETVQDPR